MSEITSSSGQEQQLIPQNKIDNLKVLPYSVEAEQSVLGGLMLSPADVASELIKDKLCIEDFYRTEHQAIFKVMKNLEREDKPIDFVTVNERLHIDYGPKANAAYLYNISQSIPSAANISAYVDIVRERSILRQLAILGTNMTESALLPKGRLSAELLDLAEKNIFAIAERGGKYRGGGPILIAEAMDKTIHRVDKLFHSGSLITGVATGFTDFDKITSGLQAGDFIIVAGRPSMGKTTFAMNIAEHVGMKSTKPVLVFSMEMPVEQLMMRMFASLARVELQRIRNGQLSDDDWTRLTSSLSMVLDKKILIDDAGGLGPGDIRSTARRVAKDYGNLGLIVIDYLQLMHMPGDSDNRSAEISKISRALKNLAKELNVPIIALSQLNRSLEQRSDKRPMMSDLRESGAIEQDADLIVFIYRDEVYHSDSNDKGTAEIIIGKQRNGPIGTVRLTFLGQYSRFESFTS